VIPSLFSSVFAWANTSRLSAAQALTRRMALFPCRVLKLPPQGFPVYGYHFPVSVLFYRPHPGHESPLNIPEIGPVKHTAVYTVFGNTMFQGEKAFQPGFFGFSVQFDVFPALGEGRHRQKGDDDNFDKGIAFFSLNPRVFDVVKKVDYRW
jgi:hypothetical protein